MLKNSSFLTDLLSNTGVGGVIIIIAAANLLRAYYAPGTTLRAFQYTDPSLEPYKAGPMNNVIVPMGKLNH